MIHRLRTLTPRSQIILIVAVTIGLRLVLAWIFGSEVADLTLYRRMADIVGRGENIYKPITLFPYTPIAMFLPAWLSDLAQARSLPFHFVFKWLTILIDAGIALLLWWQAHKRQLPHNAALWIGLAFALSPVDIIITSFHGSESILPIFFVLLAYYLVSFLPANRAYHIAAISLGVAIGLRGFPVLFVPFFLRKINVDWRRKIVFLILAAIPAGITLLPYMVVDFPAVWREVFSHSGFIDYGWVAAMRGFWFLTTSNLYLPGTLSEELLGFSKLLFLLTYAGFVTVFWRKSDRFSLLGGMLGTTLLFFSVYGGISSQYLVWVIPFALLVGSRWVTVYTWSATAALISFYLFYFPTILFGTLPIDWPTLNPPVMGFNLVFNTLFWGLCGAWFIRLLIRPTTDIALPPPNSAGKQSLKQVWQSATRNHKLALLAELALILYVGLVLALEINLLVLDARRQAFEELKIVTIWSVGNSGSQLGEIAAPLGLAVDSTGQVYLADRGNQRVAQFSPTGEALAIWSGDEAKQIPFVEPSDVAIDEQTGNVWVVDAGNGWIYRLDASRKMTAVINGAELQVYSPRGLAISSTGDVFVADTGMGRILHLNQQGQVLATLGASNSGSDQLRGPTGIAIQNNDLFVADVDNRRIVHYTLDGQRVGAFKSVEGSAWLDVDERGHILVSNSQTAKIAVYDFSGTLIGELAPTVEAAPIAELTGLASRPDGRLYVVGANQLSQFKIDWK